MTTRYLRARFLLERSTASDYSRPQIHEGKETASGSESLIDYTVTAATGGTTVDLTEQGSANDLVVMNHDTTNYVTLVYRTNGGGATDQTIAIPAAESSSNPSFVKITDWDPATALTLTADTAACDCSISCW